jgi:hypothetical protein
MNKEIAIALSKIAIIGAAVLFASASVGHSQNKSDDLKQQILAHAQGLTADHYAFTRTAKT